MTIAREINPSSLHHQPTTTQLTILLENGFTAAHNASTATAGHALAPGMANYVDKPSFYPYRPLLKQQSCVQFTRHYQPYSHEQ